MAMELAPSNLEQNNAPLLDILFNLLIFFIMACEFSERENVKLTSPRVFNPVTVNIQAKNQLVFNLVPDIKNNKPEVVRAWSVGGVEYVPYADNAKLKPVLINSFKKALLANKSPQVILRADQATPYAQIYQVMGILNEAFIDGAIAAGKKPIDTDPRINLCIAGK